MRKDPPAEVHREDLDEFTLSDLHTISDGKGEGAVTSFLRESLSVAANYLAEHNKVLSSEPRIVYAPQKRGVSYDPYHERGEVLIIGSPRGSLRGGETVLAARNEIKKKTLLSILCKGLLHAYNQQLVTEHFDRYEDSDTHEDLGSVELYNQYRMLNPAVDEGFAQLFTLYLFGDVTDQGLRDAYIERWADWFQHADFDVFLFEAIAYTIGDRVDEATGTEKDRFVYALEVQEPLIRDGDISVLSDRLPILR